MLRCSYFNFFPASFFVIFLSDGIATSMNNQVVIIIIIISIIIIIIIIIATPLFM